MFIGGGDHISPWYHSRLKRFIYLFIFPNHSEHLPCPDSYIHPRFLEIHGFSVTGMVIMMGNTFLFMS